MISGRMVLVCSAYRATLTKTEKNAVGQLIRKTGSEGCEIGTWCVRKRAPHPVFLIKRRRVS